MFPDLGSTQQQATLLVGFFLPLLLAIPVQSHWPDSLRTLVTVGAYAVAGAITAAVGGNFTGKTFWQSTLSVLALGVLGYKGVWQPSGIALGIETRTNFSDAAQAAGKVRVAAAQLSGNPARVAAAAPDAAGASPSSSSLAETVAPLVVPLTQVLERVSGRLAVPVGGDGSPAVTSGATKSESSGSQSSAEGSSEAEDPR